MTEEVVTESAVEEAAAEPHEMTQVEYEEMKKKEQELLIKRLTTRLIKIGDVDGSAKRYEGVGTLNVLTSRGEVKAQSGDYVVTIGETIFVLPGDLLEKLSPEATPPWSEGKPEEPAAEEPPAAEPPATEPPAQTTPGW